MTGVEGSASCPAGGDHGGGGGGGATSPLPSAPAGDDAGGEGEGSTGASGVPAAGSVPGCSVSSLMWILLKGHGRSRRTTVGGSPVPAAPALGRTSLPCY